MPLIQGFFFDLDDTLVGTREANFHAYRDALAESGVDFSYEQFLQTWGKDSRQFILEVAPHLTTEMVDKIRARKSIHYERHMDKTVPNTILVNFLKAMAPHHKTVLVTTAKRANGTAILKSHGIAEYFTHVIFGDDVKTGKPHPEAYLLALKKTGLKPEHALAFEDSASGIAAAEAAGISVVRIREFM